MLRGGRLNLLLRVPGHVQHAHQHAGAEPARRGTYPVSVTHRSSGASVRLLKQRHWTTHEHTRLHDLLTRYPPGPLTTQDWKHVSQHLSTGRSWQACKQRVVRLSRSAQHRQWAPLVRRPRWTREREILLVGLKLAAGRGAAWGQVAEALDAGFTAEQCAGKYARLMMAGGGKRGDRGGAGAQGSRGFNATPWRPSGDLPVPRWSEGEDEQLERLVARNGVFDFRRLRTELPGFRYATMYRALHRVFLASPVDTTTTAQRGCMDGRAGKWSEEEHAKMVRIVDACRYNASEVSQRWLSEESPMAMLSPAPQSAKLPGLMLALSRDTGRSDNHPQQAVAPRRKIDWTQVARQLATGRTPAQCRSVACCAIAKLLKLLIRQNRPSRSNRKTQGKTSYGMPSTHSAAVIYFASYLVYILHDLASSHRRMLSALSVLAIAFGSVGALSRVFNRHHTLPQVLAGSALGVSFATAWWNIRLSSYVLIEPLLAPFARQS
ncbi:hypothetical protein GGI15_001260 [Coemansia interrupta]|uniref:Myb-like domain-containing protein n=1 Tax=Coemansia interrupta TaxID=1126814 RepID=A0A9W8HPL2_9FUNG|nr:hypothetical protein GGI15_001260 [Coemansia interrupta]